jgi:hypothetical protein
MPTIEESRYRRLFSLVFRGTEQRDDSQEVVAEWEH